MPTALILLFLPDFLKVFDKKDKIADAYYPDRIGSIRQLRQRDDLPARITQT
ncbi:MAG: hypothetical protein AB4060_12460 [Crocosphaera sp.]